MPLFPRLLTLGLAACLVAPAVAQEGAVSPAAARVVPHVVRYSGTLPGLGEGGPVEVRFAVYAGQTGGEPLWSEVQRVAVDASGRYSVLLGAVTALPDAVFAAGEGRWVGVSVAGGEEGARTPIAASAYALKAEDAETLGGHPVSDFALADVKGKPDAGTDITQINVSSGILGGGTGPTVSLSADPSYFNASYAQLAAANTFSAANTFAKGFASTVATGTAPFTVASTTAVPNLNASLLGGVAAAGYAQLAAQNTFTNNEIFGPSAPATTSTGHSSNFLWLNASVWNSSKNLAQNIGFQWRAEPLNNNTASPNANFALLSTVTSATPQETGFKITANGIVTFVAGQTFPGAGTITGVTAGTGLTGGGTSGAVSLAVNPAALETTYDARYAQLGAANTYSGVQTVSGSAATQMSVSTSDNTGDALNVSGGAYGVYATASNGTGVYGLGVAGVTGETNIAGGSGVSGINTSSSGNGVYAEADGSSATALYAAAASSQPAVYVNSQGTGIGLEVENTADGEAAIEGDSTTTSGNYAAYGVVGSSAIASGEGVRGVSTGDDGYGVVGISGAAGGEGVYGISQTGVYGTSDYTGTTSNPIGVQGIVNSQYAGGSGYPAVGVWGEADGASAYGVYGNAPGSGGVGVAAVAADGYGVFATGDYGIDASGTEVGISAGGNEYGVVGVVEQQTSGEGQDGVVGVIYSFSNTYLAYNHSAGIAGDMSDGSGPGSGVLATADSLSALWAENNSEYGAIVAQNDSTGSGNIVFQTNAPKYSSSDHCTITNAANLTCSGTVSNVVGAKDNHPVAMYAVESTENWFEDFGSGVIRNGVGHVTLDPEFAATVNTGVEYHVFLTPRGDSENLFVTHATAEGFDVHESRGGQSSVAFDYRVVAKRKGYEQVRMADLSDMVRIQKAQDAERLTGRPAAERKLPRIPARVMPLAARPVAVPAGPRPAAKPPAHKPLPRAVTAEGPVTRAMLHEPQP